MRLKEWEIKNIIEAIENIFKKNHLPLNDVSVCLYGSRTDDQKKGGDIDLLLRVPNSILSQTKEIKFEMNNEIQSRIGDQKIDILIIDTTAPKDPFPQIALQESILMKKW